MRLNKAHNFLFFIFALALPFLTTGCSGTIMPTITPIANGFSTFQPPNGLFSLNVPIEWVATNAKSEGGSLQQYKFTAPDKRGFVHVVVLTQAEPISAQAAQEFVPAVLNGYLAKADTIKIITDETLDQQRKLTWHAGKGGFGGRAILEHLGSTLVFVIVSNIDEASTEYSPLFDKVLASYKTK